MQGPIELPPIIITPDKPSVTGPGFGGGYSTDGNPYSMPGIPNSPYGNASKNRLKFFNGAGTGAGWHEDFDYDEVVPSNIGMLGKLHYGVAADNSLRLIKEEHERQLREVPAIFQADVNAARAAAHTTPGLSPTQSTARDKAIVDGFINSLATERESHQAKANEYFGNDPLGHSVNEFIHSLPAYQGGQNIAPYQNWVASNTAAYSVKLIDVLITQLSQQSNALAERLAGQLQAEQAAQQRAREEAAQAARHARQEAEQAAQRAQEAATKAAEHARQQAEEAANAKAAQDVAQQAIFNAITFAPAVTPATQAAASALEAAVSAAARLLAQTLSRAVAGSAPAILALYPSTLGSGERAAGFTVASLGYLGLPSGVDLQQIANANGSVEVAQRLASGPVGEGATPQWVKSESGGPDSKVRVRTPDYDPQTNTYSFTPDGQSEPALTWTPIAQSGNSSTTTPATPVAGSTYTGNTAGPLELPPIDIGGTTDPQVPDDYILVVGPDPLYLVFNQRPGDHKYHMKPRQLPAFPDAKPTTSKTHVRGGSKRRPRWKDADGIIYEWDFQHGTLEKYDKRGNHLGEYDHETGMQTKSSDPTRRVEP